MPKVVRRTYENGEVEDLESMLKRFKRQVNDALILNECKKREFYMSKSEKRREKSKQAMLKRRKEERALRSYRPRSNSGKKD